MWPTKFFNGGLSWALAVCLASVGVARAEDSQDRGWREAKEIFRVVLGASPPEQPCEISTDWDRYPISERVRKELGFRLHGRLVGSAGIDLPKIVDPNGQVAAAFCTREQAQKAEAGRLAEFEAIENEKELLVTKRRQ